MRDELQKEFTYFVGQLNLGRLSNDEINKIIDYVNSKIKTEGFEGLIKPADYDSKVRKKMVFSEPLAKAAEIVTVVGGISRLVYWVLPFSTKKKIDPDYIYKKTKEWYMKNKSIRQKSRNKKHKA